MTGYVHLHRAVWDHPVFRDRVEAAAFVWMCSQAAWKPCRVRYKGVALHLGRGQLAVSTRDLAADWGWSEAKARRFLSRLKTDAMIDAHSDAGVNVVTICNYDKYQASGADGDAPRDAPSDAAPTHHRRTEQRREEVKKERKGEEITAPSPSPACVREEPPPAAARNPIRECLEHIGAWSDPCCQLSGSRVSDWMRMWGADPDLDIKPTLAEVLERARARNKDQTWLPGSMKYFDQAVRAAVESRTNPKPEPTKHERRDEKPRFSNPFAQLAYEAAQQGTGKGAGHADRAQPVGPDDGAAITLEAAGCRV